MPLTAKDILEYCRLCQTKPGVLDFSCIDNFNEMVFQCTRVKIDDELTNVMPRFVCDDCRSTVEEFFKFLQDVQKTDSNLRKIIPKRTIKTRKKLNSESKNANKYTCPDCKRKYTKHSNFIFHKEKGICRLINKIKSTSPTANENPNLQLPDSAINKETHLLNVAENNSVKCNIDGRLKLDESYFESKEEISQTDIGTCDATESSFPCDVNNCEKVFRSKSSLRNHKFQHGGRIFLCTTCGKSFATRNSLLCHEKTHLEKKAYVCTKCYVSFSVRCNLRTHIKKHHEGFKYYCSQCTKEFFTKDSLERHEVVHTGVRNFKCKSCDRAFYTNKELIKHQRYHQGVRPYKCEVCFKSFYEKHHLIVHNRIHTGEKPYVCEVNGCGKSFAEKQKLSRHSKARHITK